MFEASFVASDSALYLYGDGNITFSSQAIGDAAADRLIVVAVAFTHDYNSSANNSLTVGGVSATKIVGDFDSPGSLSQDVAIWVAAVPSGTTADIVVGNNRTSGDKLGAIIGVYRLTGASATAVDTSSGNSTDPISLNLDVGAEGLIVAAMGTRDSEVSWSGVAERGQVEGYSDAGISVADYFSSGSEAPRSVSGISDTYDSLAAACAASFGPT